MTRDGVVTFRRETAGMGRPLLFSAAAHVLALSAALQFGVVSAAVPFRGVVQVLLVEDSEGVSGGPGRTEDRRGGAEKGGPGRSPVPDALAAAADSASPSAEPAAIASTPAPAVEAPVPPAVRPLHQASRQVLMEETVTGYESAREGRPAPPEGMAGTGDPGGVAAPGSGGSPAGSAGPASGSGPRRAMAGPGAGSGSGAGRGDAALLRERIRSRIVYPEEAVRRGQQGEVLLRIRVLSGGFPGEIVVARSSGARLLDDAARRGVARAAPLPSEPGWVEVPVLFRLR